MDGGQSTGTRADLDTLAAEVLIEDSSVADKDNVLLLELLLQLTDETAGDLPGLLVDAVWNGSNDGLLAVNNVKLGS